MKISAILDHIDTGHMALPEFRRGYVWTITVTNRAGFRCFTTADLRQYAEDEIFVEAEA